MATNPRYSNGHARRVIRARLKARGDVCGICGRSIDYSLGMIVDERTGKKRPHPMSYVVDEILPVSKGGSPIDINNCRAAHWLCNARRGDGTRKKQVVAPLPRPFEDW